LSVDDEPLLGWSNDIRNPKELTADDGCFYMKVVIPDWSTADEITVDGNNKQQVGFKVSWMNPARPSGYDGYDDNQRYWATYDLGIIGVNDLHPNISDYAKLIVDGQYAVFSTDKSVPYLKYNQYNWTIVRNDNEATSTYYAVIDTHDTCGSVTLCSFDPEPNVKIKETSISRYRGKLVGAEADMMARGDYFRGNSGVADEDKAHFEKVNVAGAEATIDATDKATLTKGGFTRTFDVTINGVKALSATAEDGVDIAGKTYTLENMPFATDESGDVNQSIAIRALIKDVNTGLQFHTRTGKGTFEGITTIGKQPELSSVTGQYVINRVETDGTAVYDLYVTGLRGYFDPTVTTTEGEDPIKLNAYADYKFFFTGDADHPLTSKLIVKDDNEKSDYTRLNKLNLGVPDVNLGDLNWSQYLMTVGADDNQNQFPVLLSEVAKLKNGESTNALPQHISYRVYAVYPFLYDENAKAQLKAAPRRSGEEDATSSDAESAENAENVEVSFAEVSGYYITTNRQPVGTELEIEPEVVSGIEAVNSDTQDLYAPVEYYTISGVRVSNNPGPGIYIRRQGNTVTKVAIR
jgi:hypothetical protein